MKLHESFPDDIITSSDIQVSYLEGNTEHLIFEELDLDVMYDSFEPGLKITLWCNGIRTESTLEPRCKEKDYVSVSAINKTTDNVDQIFKELKSNTQTWKTQHLPRESQMWKGEKTSN